MEKIAIVYFPYLPPRRIDIFKKMDKFDNLALVFTVIDNPDFIYNRKAEIGKLKKPEIIFLKGFKFRYRPIHVPPTKILSPMSQNTDISWNTLIID